MVKTPKINETFAAWYILIGWGIVHVISVLAFIAIMISNKNYIAKVMVFFYALMTFPYLYEAYLKLKKLRDENQCRKK